MSIVSETDDLRQELKEASGVRRPWLAASAAWIAVIIFSSTSLASEYCERAFTWIVGSTVGKHFTSAKAYDWLHFLAEKSLHLTLFFVLGVLLWQVFTGPRRRRLAQVILLGLIVGSASELLQAAFPDRDPAIRDVLINVVGAFLGAVACDSKGRHWLTCVCCYPSNHYARTTEMGAPNAGLKIFSGTVGLFSKVRLWPV